MSRVTPPVTKLVSQGLRSISSSSSAGRPSALLDSKARANAYLPRALKDLKAECSKRHLKSTGSKSELVERLTAHDIVGSHGFHTLGSGPHRPLPAQAASVHKTIPLMQGFQTSAPKQTAHDASTIDYMFLPGPLEEPPKNPFSKLRVPLLPDNYTPDRSAGSINALETLDEAVPGSEINIMAGQPEHVAAALSEVVGNDGLDVDIGQLTSAFITTQTVKPKEPGVLSELWSGFVDDILGPKGGNAKVAV